MAPRLIKTSAMVQYFESAKLFTLSDIVGSDIYKCHHHVIGLLDANGDDPTATGQKFDNGVDVIREEPEPIQKAKAAKAQNKPKAAPKLGPESIPKVEAEKPKVKAEPIPVRVEAKITKTPLDFVSKVEYEIYSKEMIEKCAGRATKLLESGKAFDYMVGVWRNRTRANLNIGRTFFVSAGCSWVSNSTGLHVLTTGAPGYSKTFMTKMALELMPNKLKWDSDLSDRALYYPPPELQDGTVMFIDDIEWTNTLGVSVKKTITNFQEGSTSTIVKELESEVLHTRKRLSFWMTSVDNQADDQIRDRLFAHSLPSNKEDATRIINQMKKTDQGKGLIRNREATLTCKIIVELLSEKFNQVLIPFDDEIIFTGDPRAYKMFSDIVKGLVAFQALAVGRGPVDGVLTATKKDLEYAAKIYNGLGGHDPDKFSIPEGKVVDAIAGRPGHEANRQQIISATGLSGSRVDAVIYGRGKDLQKKNGLMDKCGLSTRVFEGRKIFCLDVKTLSRRVSKVSLEWAIPEYIKEGFVVPAEFKKGATS